MMLLIILRKLKTRLPMNYLIKIVMPVQTKTFEWTVQPNSLTT